MRNVVNGSMPIEFAITWDPIPQKFNRQRKDVTSIDVESKQLVKKNKVSILKCQMRLNIKTPQIRIDYLSPC
jgi:hypothetical protein